METETEFVVDATRCTRCRSCVRDCPSGIIQQEGDNPPYIRTADEPECMECQHCLAVCPTAAVSILGRKPEDSLGLAAESLPSLDAMMRLVRGRRTVRHYRDENVDPALLRRILAALANAPTGVNSRKLTFRVIDDKTVMQRFRETSLAALAEASRTGKLPETFAWLSDAVSMWEKDRDDLLMRGAPHLLVVSAPPDAPCPGEDVNLALAYFELMAQSAGLGTVWCGLVKMLLEAVPAAKAMIGVPSGHLYYPMLFGVPSVRYARTVQRDDAAAVVRVRL